MKYYSRFKVVCALYACYLLGSLLSTLFVMQNNRVGVVLEVLIPTIAILAYISLITQQVQPRKKKLPAMQVQTTRKRG